MEIQQDTFLELCRTQWRCSNLKSFLDHLRRMFVLLLTHELLLTVFECSVQMKALNLKMV